MNWPACLNETIGGFLAPAGSVCRGCGSSGMVVFYEHRGAPACSGHLIMGRDRAVKYRRGDILMGFCPSCAFISNTAYKPGIRRCSNYEGTKEFSLIYNMFARGLARELIGRYGIHHKKIIDIGCGNGEFLAMLCEEGDNIGVGFDPSYSNGRISSKAADRMYFIKERYSKKYSGYKADFIVCMKTLDHINNTGEFLSTIRGSIGERRDTIVFFIVADVRKTLDELAFWGMHYDRCSYFCPASLKHAMDKAGFGIIEMRNVYEGQYLFLSASPARSRPGATALGHADGGDIDMKEISRSVRNFAFNHRQKIAVLKKRLEEIAGAGYRAVAWGSGSRCAAFLNTLDIKDEIRYAVDINPYRQGTYVAGTGQEIVPPEFLREYRPDAVIIMNPVYTEEVNQELKKMRLSAEIITI